MEDTYNDPYRREVVMARVGHLIRRKQHEVEKITRIIRACFAAAVTPDLAAGRITRIILIGPYARRSWYEDSKTIDHSDYEFWVIVSHPALTHERYWEQGEGAISGQMASSCAVTLNVYSEVDIIVARNERDHFILDRIEAGITLYDDKRDAPLTTQELDWWGRRERRHARS